MSKCAQIKRTKHTNNHTYIKTYIDDQENDTERNSLDDEKYRCCLFFDRGYIEDIISIFITAATTFNYELSLIHI